LLRVSSEYTIANFKQQNKVTQNKTKSWTLKHNFKETDLPILQVKLTEFTFNDNRLLSNFTEI